MPGATTGHDLPFPLPADDDNIPADVQALAQAVDDALTDHEDTLVPKTRAVATGVGLLGGDDLSGDVELSVDFAASGVSSSTKAVKANDVRLSDHDYLVGVVQPSGDVEVDAHHPLFNDVPGLTKTFASPDAINEYMVRIDLDVTLHGNSANDQPTCVLALLVDGVEQTKQVRVGVPVAGTVRIPVSRTWPLTNLSAASHTVKIQIATEGGAVLPGNGGVTILAADSQMIVERVN